MLSNFVNFTLWGVAAVASLPLAGLSLELLLALLPGRASPDSSGAVRRRLAILIPAHNESLMIESTVRALVPQLVAGDRLLVVADNCSDNTADLARGAGAEVIERTDPNQRGKGFALDFGVRHLAADPPDILVIVDSDVNVRSTSLDALARQVDVTNRPAQSVYILQPPADAGTKDEISHIAFTVRNRIRPRGLMRIAGVCPLFGAGMAFPWGVISRAPLASGNIVEDLALALDLAADGSGPMLCEAARVDGTLVALSHGDNLKQRRRWEHGHMRTILGHAPRVIARGITRFRPRAIVLGLDVMIPPLSLLTASTFGIAVLLLILGALPRISIAPGILLASWLIVAGALVVLAWLKFAETDNPMRPLRSIPGYVARKLPLYASFFSKAEQSWQRAARPGEVTPPDTTSVKNG